MMCNNKEFKELVKSIGGSVITIDNSIPVTSINTLEMEFVEPERVVNSLGYDEWLLIGSEPKSSKTFENEDIYDNDGNMLCIYCFVKLPKEHSVTVCDDCYEGLEN